MEYSERKFFENIVQKDLPNRFNGAILGYNKTHMFISSEQLGMIRIGRFKRKVFEDDNIEIKKILEFVRIVEHFDKVEKHGKQTIRKEKTYHTFDLNNQTKEKGDRTKFQETNLINSPEVINRKQVKIPQIIFSKQSDGLHDFELIGIRDSNTKEMRFLFDGRDVRATIPIHGKWKMPKRRQKIKVYIEKYNNNKNGRLMLV